jgi:2-desacetyl-2-hydroxyethyl bacteriochlorophyllide A dehydrogenase
MSTMRAAVFCGDERVELRPSDRPEPSPGEVCVRLEGCGVCASNVPVWSGRPWFRYPLGPGAPGHEGWGEVFSIGESVTDVAVGDRVALLSGRAYAEYDLADASSVVRIPASLAGRPVPGEPLACAMNIFRRSDIQPGQRVAVVGVGFIGAILIQLATRAGAQVLAIARRSYACEVARRCGASEAIATADVPSAIGAAMEAAASGYPRVIEAAGEQATLDIASALVAEGGRLVIAGYHQDGPRQVDMQQWNWRGIDVVNAHERDPAVAVRGLREAMVALDERRIDLSGLITHRYPIGALPEAFAALCTRPAGFLKAVVEP